MKRSKGFTIIELLIVIAIIGLLVAIISVSLNSSRNKAKDVKIKQLMAEIRATAEIFYISQNPVTFVGLGGFADMGTIKTAIENAGGTIPTLPGAFYTTDKYCIQYKLNGTGSWCVDSTGYRGIIASCEGVNYNCANP